MPEITGYLVRNVPNVPVHILSAHTVTIGTYRLIRHTPTYSAHFIPPIRHTPTHSAHTDSFGTHRLIRHTPTHSAHFIPPIRHTPTHSAHFIPPIRHTPSHSAHTDLFGTHRLIRHTPTDSAHTNWDSIFRMVGVRHCTVLRVYISTAQFAYSRCVVLYGDNSLRPQPSLRDTQTQLLPDVTQRDGWQVTRVLASPRFSQKKNIIVARRSMSFFWYYPTIELCKIWVQISRLPTKNRHETSWMAFHDAV